MKNYFASCEFELGSRKSKKKPKSMRIILILLKLRFQ